MRSQREKFTSRSSAPAAHASSYWYTASPIEDVVGFIRYAGKGCKLSGLWKVYGDAEAASRLFDRLSRVCHAVTRRVDKGETLLEVFAA